MVVETLHISKVVQTLQRYIVFRGLSYLLYAGLWLYYLQCLMNTKTHIVEYCRDVQPTLRSVLLVFAWIKLVVSILFVCVVLSSLLVDPSVEMFVFTLAMLIIVGVFLYQIHYINAVEQSTARTDQCDEVESRKRSVVYIFSVATFGFGVFLVAFGASGGSLLQQMVSAVKNKET